MFTSIQTKPWECANGFRIGFLRPLQVCQEDVQDVQLLFSTNDERGLYPSAGRRQQKGCCGTERMWWCYGLCLCEDADVLRHSRCDCRAVSRLHLKTFVSMQPAQFESEYVGTATFPFSQRTVLFNSLMLPNEPFL